MPDTELLDSFRADAALAREETRAGARARLLVSIAADDAPARRPGRRRGLVPRRQRRQMLVTVLAILCGLLALPSLGLGSRLVDLVRTGAHKPPTVNQELASSGHLGAPWNSKVIVSKTRRLLAVSSGHGRAVLWAAPTRKGGACYVVRSPRLNGGGCLGPEPFAHRLVPSLSGALGGRRSASIAGARWAMLVGHAGGNAARVELRYADGGRSVLPFAHGWFLFAVPSLHRTAGHQPIALVSVDARGRVLEQETRLFHPFASRH
jgi:hypothetical protein